MSAPLGVSPLVGSSVVSPLGLSTGSVVGLPLKESSVSLFCSLPLSSPVPDGVVAEVFPLQLQPPLVVPLVGSFTRELGN